MKPPLTFQHDGSPARGICFGTALTILAGILIFAAAGWAGHG